MADTLSQSSVPSRYHTISIPSSPKTSFQQQREPASSSASNASGGTAAVAGNRGSVTDRDATEKTHKNRTLRAKLRHAFETREVHFAILTLTLIDITIVFGEIIGSSVDLDSHGKEEEEPELLHVLGVISLIIVSLFVVELILALYAFGFRRFYKDDGWLLHLIDAIVILTSFLFEVFLKGRTRDISELIIVFRLWRVVRLVSTVVVEYGNHEEARLHETQQELLWLKQENIQLKHMLSVHGIALASPKIHNDYSTGGAEKEAREN